MVFFSPIYLRRTLRGLILRWLILLHAALLLGMSMPACAAWADGMTDSVTGSNLAEHNPMLQRGKLSQIPSVNASDALPALSVPGQTSITSPAWIRDESDGWMQRGPAQQRLAMLAGGSMFLQTMHGQTALQPGLDYRTNLTEARLSGPLLGQGVWAEAMLRVSKHQLLDTQSPLNSAAMQGQNELGAVAGGIQLSYVSEDKWWAVGGQLQGQWQPGTQPQMPAKAPIANTSGNMQPPPAPMPAAAAPATATALWQQIRWQHQYFAELQVSSQTRLRASMTLSTDSLQSNAVSMQPKLSLQHAFSPRCIFTARVEGSASGNTAQNNLGNQPRYLVNLTYQLSPAASMAAELSNTGLISQNMGSQSMASQNTGAQPYSTTASGTTLNMAYTFHF